jgi:hypothetical protein
VATIHIREIQQLLRGRANNTDDPSDNSIEIRFDEATESSLVADEEMRNKVITGEAPQGSVVVVFDDLGFLRSLDIS